ncbi:uncharacterized protein LOC124442997 isoform X2 [Xenia sp. Carnegie-2017]|uniref:uncharacterized protein LOC124442997 isoform X2 n=1 Tax=Xenia sp. Carnegie-2017 TaxID=2897299 RepID=UPI001F035504|nr:uncharacterized protein LOC124442997 isoform X2 [Xenia sp. Carnegie-2017]
MEDFLGFDDDDITDSMTAEDLQRLEMDAWRKVTCKSDGAAMCPEPTYGLTVNQWDSNDLMNDASQITNVENRLHVLNIKIEELERNARLKDGQLALIRQKLETRQREVRDKDNIICNMRLKYEEEKSQRDGQLMQEIKALKTQLSFQKHELMKLETQNKNQKIFSTHDSFSASQRQSRGSLKRKANSLSSGFDAIDSFVGSQKTNCAMSIDKVPKLEKSDVTSKFLDVLNSEISVRGKGRLNKSRNMVKEEENFNCSKDLWVENRASKIYKQFDKQVYLVKKLLAQWTDNCYNNGFEVFSLLTLLKHPMKYLDEVLDSHCVDVTTELSQFSMRQTQTSKSQERDKELYYESGKFDLVSHGLSLLLVLNNNPDSNIGFINILVVLELYLTSFIYSRQRSADSHKHHKKFDKSSTSKQNFTDTTCHDDEEMLVLTLKVLKVLFHSVSSVVHWVLDRTKPELFKQDDLIITYDSKEVTKEDPVQTCNIVTCNTDFDANKLKSFQSLLLQNMNHLLTLFMDDATQIICFGTLDVLVAMTTTCDQLHLERLFSYIHYGSLMQHVTKNNCNIPKMSRITMLLTNLLPCKNIRCMLCSGTDDCILLKIYQCACEEEPEDNEQRQTFILQFIELLNHYAFSQEDAMEFLLDSDCQCSFEIIRCLVLILYDEVNYLLDMDGEQLANHDRIAQYYWDTWNKECHTHRMKQYFAISGAGKWNIATQ